MKRKKNTELPKYVNESDVFLYICDAKRKLKDGKCTGESCMFLYDDGTCERTTDIYYAKNEFDWKNFEFLEHKQRESKYDYDVYSERNSKGEYI